VIDWKPYGPSAGALASFLSTGVRDAQGQMIGVFCTQMPPESQPITASGTAILVAKDTALIVASEGLLHAYVNGAVVNAPTLQGMSIDIASTQREVAQGMCKHAVLLGMGATAARRLAAANGTGGGTSVVTVADLKHEMEVYEKNHHLLHDGGVYNGKTVKAIVDPVVGASLEDAYSSWLTLKPTLQSIVDGAEATEPVLRNVVTQTDALVSDMDEVFVMLATTTRTTTLMTLEILSPMPFQGDWTGGATMKVSSLLAEGLINEQQKILPGYNLKSVFFDDKCDSVESSRTVLGEMATKDTYIALGGAGCSTVCEQTAFAASSIRLPFLSYECPSAALSDTQTYPDLTRFGTITTAAIDVFAAIGKNFSWPRITVIAGDPSKYGAEATGMRDKFIEKGFASDYVYAFENEWDAILAMMTTLRENSKGEKRIYYLLGTEDYFRKVICASIVAEAETGITWLSQGTKVDDWWTKPDALAGLHRKWLLEDTGGDQLKAAFTEFKESWDQYLPNSTNEERRKALAALYQTEQKENLDVVAGSEQYHAVHKKWHPTYRKSLYDRAYYDIFIFDLKGDCIYSVYKESDYATNFDVDGQGEWKDSGLGDAFRAAIAAPDNVTYIDWKPYGPSAGALAAFLSTGIRNADGEMVGVYTIQLPPDYVRSIEQTQPECTLEKIAESFEGAINVVGLGRPTDENMVKPLPCFDGHSPQSFNSLLDQHLEGGYPLGDRATQVPDPYGMMKANAADAICVVAFTVKYLLEQGYKIEDIQRPDAALYEKFITYVKTTLDFQGASGRVKFSGNDKPHYLAVQQVQKGSNVDVGLVAPESKKDADTKDADTKDPDGKFEWTNGGPDGTYWKREKVDPLEPDNFPYWVFRVFVPLGICMCPTIFGVFKGLGDAKRLRETERLKT